MSQPSPFVKKTYDFVSDPTLNDVVSWSEGGDSFVIWKPHELQVNVLPRFFKHNNLCSFIRQLNTYDFRKVAGTTGDANSDVLEFRNSNFRRDAPELLGAITRKKPGKKGTNVGVVQSQSHPTIRSVEQKINLGEDPLRDFSPDDLELIAQTCLGSSDANREDLRRIMSDSNAMINAISSLSTKQERAEQMLQTVSHELANAQRMIATLQARRGSNGNFPPGPPASSAGTLPFAPASMARPPANHTMQGERRNSFEQPRRGGWNEAEMPHFDPSQLEQAQEFARQQAPNQRQYMGVERAPQYSSPSPQLPSTPTQNGMTRRDSDASNGTEDMYKAGRSNIVVKSETTTVEASPSPLVPIVIPTRNEVAALAKKGKSEEQEQERR